MNVGWEAITPEIVTLLIIAAAGGGFLTGAYGSRHFAGKLPRSDAKKAQKFNEIKDRMETVDSKSADDVVEEFKELTEPSENSLSIGHYEDFVYDLYSTLYGEDSTVPELRQQMKEIRDDKDKLVISGYDPAPLKQIVGEVRKEHDAYETDTSSLDAEFFVTLEKYLRNPDGFENQELRNLLDRVGESLSETTSLRKEINTLESTLNEYDYEGTGIPENPEWGELFESIDEEGRIVGEVRTLIGVLRNYEKELSAEREFRARYEQRSETLDELEEELDDPWVHTRLSNGESQGEHYLLEAARMGIIGPRVIRQVASELSTESDLDNATLIETFAEASTESKTEIEELLRNTVDDLQEFETINLQLKDVDQEDLPSQIDSIRYKIMTTDPSVDTRILADYLDRLESKIDRISSNNRLDLYAISAQLDHLESLSSSLESDGTDGSLQEISQELDEKRDSVEEMLTPGNYDINTGHNISREFVDLADDLRHNARVAQETGDISEARAFYTATIQLLETVEGLYKDTQLRRWLQHV